jgi:alcohol dehydrogenase
MTFFEFQSQVRVVFGEGAVAQLGELARQLGFRRTLIVSDRGLVQTGHVEEAATPLRDAGVEVFTFHDFDHDPDSTMIEAGRAIAARLEIDSIVGLGGGSSMDCAKGINFVLTNGGSIVDYCGFGKASKPMLPMIGIPTTAGTGSEAQSYALISDATTHLKMACGDPKAAFKVAILDPALTVSQPASVTATAGFDAISHAVETWATTKRTPFSDLFSREAWRLLERNYKRVLNEPTNIEARAAMQFGAFFAGVAIENSMLGATHACANPLTTRYGTIHGVAIAMLLPHVVRWNGAVSSERYADLLAIARLDAANPGESLALRLEELAEAGNLSTRVSAIGVVDGDLGLLAEEAAGQWTGRFNPRAFGAAEALEIYRSAL